MLAQYGEAQQAQFQPAFDKFFELRFGGLLGNLHGDLWVVLQVAAEPGEQVPCQRYGAGVTEAKATAQAITDFVGHATGFFQFAEQAACAWQERLARRCQARLAGGALEQWRVEQVFQHLDLPAQGRLGDVQALGGGTEAAAVGDFNEVAQLSRGDH